MNYSIIIYPCEEGSFVFCQVYPTSDTTLTLKRGE